MEPTTFKFTVELAHDTYALLLRESRSREGSKGAVPSRTARQLVEERLEEINAEYGYTPEPPTGIPTEEETQPEYAKEDQPEKSKKTRSRKKEVDADESTPTV